MKKIILLLFVSFCFFQAKAQPACAYTHSVTGNTANFSHAWAIIGTQSVDSVRFDYGDGSPSVLFTVPVPGTSSHTYPGPGVYNTCLTRYISSLTQPGVIQCTFCDSVTIQGTSSGCTTTLQTIATNNSVIATGSATGGTAPYFYSYTLNPGSVTNTTGIFNGLTPGLYTVCVTAFDAMQNLCSTTCDSVSVGNVFGCNTTLAATSTTNSINAVAVGSFGTPPYTYSYTLNPGNVTNTTGSFTGLTFGSYSVCATATDASNQTCTVDCDSIGVGISFVCNTTLALSSSGNTVTATPTTTGGTAPYSYSYNLNPGNITNTTGVFPGLLAGQYTVCVTSFDAIQNLCSSACDSITVGNSLPCSTTIQSIVNGNSIVSNAIATGGFAPYTYSYNLNPGNITNSTGIFTGLANGPYTICAIAIDAQNNTCSIACDSVFVTGSQGCNTAITLSGSGTSINATATASFGTAPYTFSYTLNPGNITNTTGIFTGLAPGTYIVCATATDALNVVCSSDCDSTSVGNTIGCNTAVTASANGTTIIANAGASFGTAPYTYSYTLNPGNITNTTGIFTGLAAGGYVVCATATDAMNIVCTPDCDSAWIGNGPGSCFVTAQFTQSINGLNVNFINNSTIAGGTITSTNWSFGDGNFSTANSPSHSYATPGTYTVTLGVTGADANQAICADSTLKQMTLSYPTSVSNASANALNIYPNPTSNNFTIELPTGEKMENLLITDVAGRKITANYGIEKNNFISVNLDNQASGIYFIKLQTNSKLYTSSIMKQE